MSHTSCCGKKSVESLLDKFKTVNATIKHSVKALTTQTTNR